MSDDRPGGPAVHVLDYPGEVHASDNDIRDGDVVLVPLWAQAAVRIDGRTLWLTGGTDHTTLTPAMIEHLQETYAASFALAQEEIGRRVEFTAPAEVRENGLGWRRLTLPEHRLECGDYVMRDGRWLSVESQTITNLGWDLLVRTWVWYASDEGHEIVRTVNIEDQQEEHWAVWRALPLTVLDTDWEFPRA